MPAPSDAMPAPSDGASADYPGPPDLYRKVRFDPISRKGPGSDGSDPISRKVTGMSESHRNVGSRRRPRKDATDELSRSDNGRLGKTQSFGEIQKFPGSASDAGIGSAGVGCRAARVGRTYADKNERTETMSSDVVFPEKTVALATIPACDLCADFRMVTPPNPAVCDSPVTLLGRTTWAYSCPTCYALFASGTASAVGTRLTLASTD